jgi:CubicO group peptidase (beta-lactamase class C family)
MELGAFVMLDRSAAIERVVLRAIGMQAIPGLAILAAEHGRVVFSGGYGQCDLVEARPVDERTIFSIASISKQFTAAAIFRQMERGRLRLDDRAGRYLPWWLHAPEVTIEQLLTHTSGVPGYTELEDFDLRCFEAATPREIVAATAHLGQAFEPGADWQYSNTNYVILAAILEAVAQQPYAALLQSEFFDPLDLHSTTAGSELAAVQGIASFALGPWESTPRWQPSWEIGTAGIHSNVHDLFAWNVALRTGRVVSETTYRTMTSDVVLNDGTRVNYGCGLQLGHTPIGREIRHSGGLPGFSLENTVYSDREIDIIVLTNADWTTTRYSITLPIAAALTDERGMLTADGVEWRLRGRPIPQFGEARAVLDDFRSGRLPPERMTSSCRRLLTPRHVDALQALCSHGPVRELFELERFRRHPLTMYTYEVVCDAGSFRAELGVHDDGRIASIYFCRWDHRAHGAPD